MNPFCYCGFQMSWAKQKFEKTREDTFELETDFLD